MPRLTTALALSLSFTLLVSVPPAFRPAQAQNPLKPVSQDELLKSSELAIEGEILGVACTGLLSDRPKYHAWVQVAEVLKGEAERAATIQVGWVAPNPDRFGTWAPQLFPGARSSLYLVKATEPGVWKVFHADGAVNIRPAPPESRTLPQTPGQVSFRTMPSPPPRTGAPEPDRSPEKDKPQDKKETPK